MSRIVRNDKVKHLLDKHKFNSTDIEKMNDDQIEYYHWLYFEDSVDDYM